LILVDANLLIYAFDDTSSHYAEAHDWLDRQLNGTSAVGLPWESITAFLRVVTNPRIYGKPTSIAIAWQQVKEWLDAEPAWIPLPTERHREILEEFMLLAGIRANLVPDAHLAALAIGHGLTLCSADSGFARFPRLRWLDPLMADR
jgi:uncharacterized protein